MINYVTKYQNSFVSSFLFNKSLSKLMELGISVVKLLDTEIFCLDYEVDEWPSTHW